MKCFRSGAAGLLIAISLATLSGMGAPAIAAETVRFALTGPSTVAIGERFRVELSIDSAGQGISEIPFIIGYDPSVLEVLAVEPGPFLGSDADFRPEVDRDEGRIRVDAARRDGTTNPPPGVLATLLFKVTRRFSSTPVVGMTMAPVSLDGRGLPPEYPPTLHLRNRGK